MEVIAEKDIEVVIDNVGEVSTDSALEVDVIDNTELAVSVNRKEFNIVGDELYIPKRYEDAPQWLRDLISKVTEESYARKITDLNNLSTSLKQLIIELDVAKNTYTQSIISSNDIDERINTAVTTLNSSLSKSDATIVDLISTKATPSEASAIALNVISSSINDGEIGALVGSVKNTLTTETEVLANNIDLVHAEMSKGFEGTADAIQITQTYVGIDEKGGSTGTGLLADVQILQKQNDGVIETVTGTYDVMINPQDPNLAELVLTAEPYASWKAKDVKGIDTRLAHIGDVYVKYRITSNGAREYLASFKFIRTIVDASDAHKSTDADGFTWALIVDQASQDAYTQALNARDLADGKRRVYVGLGSKTTPRPPYDQGDLWLIDSERIVDGYQCKVGDILRCKEAKGIIGSYEENDWVLASSYANAVAAQAQSVQDWIDGPYSTTITDINTQLDQKAESYYQDIMPHPEGTSTAYSVWVGDLWKKPSTNDEYVYQLVDGTYVWVKTDVPDSVYDTIDGKKSIFSGNTVPTAIGVNDMWITGDAPVSPYLAKSIYIWNGDEAKWVMPVRYTDDQYARSIVDGTSQIDLSQHINSLGWTDDSTVDDFIVGTYAKDLLNISNQIDGVAVTYFQNEAPYLASAGTSANSGDVWYDTNASTPTAYKFKYKTLGQDGVTVVSPSEWTIITNAFVLSSLEAASKTKAAADRSIKNYTSTPVTPYYIGDTWMQGSTGDIYVCQTERLTGSFDQKDWIIASKYTDDSRVIQLETGIADGSIAFNLNSAVVGGKPLTTYVADEIDKEVVVYSGTNHLDYSSLGSLKPNDLYIEKTTAVGTSGVAVDVLNTWKCLTVSPTAGVVTSATWLQIGNNNNITALADLADGKRTVFSGSVVPSGAVSRDIWIPSADVAITTSAMCTVAGGTWTTVCSIPKYLSGEIYQFSSSGKWLLATKYSANLESVRSSLQNQLDGKVETYYQSTVPTGMAAINNGDYWYCTADVSTYKKGKVYKYVHATTSWVETADVSREAFDLADGKSAIFTTESKPSVYSKNDMMIVTGTFNNGTTEFSDGVVLTATVDSTSFVAAHWVKKINDTEDLDAYKKVVNPQLTALKEQIDGKVENWFQNSTNDPKTAWAVADRAKHDGDTWYQTDTKKSYWYSSSNHSWNLIEDEKAIKALANAATAQATADGVVVSYYAIRQDTQPAFSKLWFHNMKVGDELKYVLQKYEESSWVNVDVKQGDTLTTYDTDTKDTSIYLYNSGNWITETENGIVSSSEAITKLNANLEATDKKVSGHTDQLSTVDARIEGGVASVETKWAYNSTVKIDGVSYNSGFGLATKATSGSGLTTTGESEFWIKADKFKLVSADGLKKSSYSPFNVDSVTGEINFNGKVSFANTTGGQKAIDDAKGEVLLVASEARTSATEANTLLSDIASDSKLTAKEKISTKKEWDIIVSEKVKNTTQATTYGVSTTDYNNAYNSLDTYITPLLSSLTTTSDIVGITFRSMFKAYYDARTDLLNAIATKVGRDAKDYTETSLSVVNMANVSYSTFDDDTLPELGTLSNGYIERRTDTSWIKFGGAGLMLWATGTDSYVYLGKTNSDYNINIPTSQSLIVSAWVKVNNGTGVIQLYSRTNDGVHFGTSHTIPLYTWTRISHVINSGSNTKMIVRIDNDGYSGTKSALAIDGIMVEKNLSDGVPSTYVRPNSINGITKVEDISWQSEVQKAIDNNATYINGSKITTGSITADQINLNNLFAQNITYTGVITGGNKAGGGIIQSYNGKMKIDLVNGSIYIA